MVFGGDGEKHNLIQFLVLFAKVFFVFVFIIPINIIMKHKKKITYFQP